MHSIIRTLTAAVLLSTSALSAHALLLPHGGNYTGPPAFYVAPPPTGNDSNPGTAAQPFATLGQAQTAMRGGGTKTTYLATGTYVLPATMTFASADNGETWTAQAGQFPIISGGQDLTTGWTQHDTSVPAAVIWQHTGVNWDFRELYVNGVHAVRAGAPRSWASAAGAGSLSGWGGVGSPQTGFTVPAATAAWGNTANIEFVSLYNWEASRCRVASVAGTTFTMSQPCFARLIGVCCGLYPSPVQWVENAYELLAASGPGSWYWAQASGGTTPMNVTANTLYYIPRAGETMNSVPIVVPKVETLISGIGVSNLTFNRISFEFEANIDPDTAGVGWVPVQSDLACIDPSASTTNCWPPTDQPDTSMQWLNGVLLFAPDGNGNGCQNITIQHSLFTHLGGTGMYFRHGCQNANILANKCTDNAGGCIQWGDHDGPLQTNTALQTAHLTATNNLVADQGFEYPGSSALYQGFANYSTIQYNEFVSAWSGIAIGWKTQNPPPNSYSTPNTVQYNYIHDYCAAIFPNNGDCGGIYTTGAVPNGPPYQTYNGNYMLHGTTGYGCIYADENSSYTSWTNNVCDTPTIAGNNFWAYLHMCNWISVTSSWSTKANATSGDVGNNDTLAAPTTFTNGCVGAACNGAQAYMPPNSGIQAGVTPGP
jgi:hypothetical protein